MNILVTGGSGRIGRVTVAHLLAQGHRVRIVDYAAEAELDADVRAQIEGAPYHQVDITDYAALRPHFDGMDGGINAVVHLAAIPYPAPDRDAEIFDINCAGTFNVYLAAADVGIQRVVSASSINALGNKFGIQPTPLEYLPIDEAHPKWTTDVYSFSKQVGEETAAYFWRRNGISGTCMRFPWVYDPAQLPEDGVKENVARIRREYGELAAMSKSERQAALQAVEDQVAALRDQRRQGLIEMPEMFQKIRALPYQGILFGLRDFWAILDVRDAAHAIALALTAEYDGAHVLNIADQCNATGVPTKDLTDLFYPDITTWKRPLSGLETLFSIENARRLIGFAPQHSIQPWLEED